MFPLNILRLSASLPPADMLGLVRGGEAETLRVVAHRRLLLGDVKLSPAVNTASSIVPRTNVPGALTAEVDMEGQGKRTMFVLGSTSVPNAGAAGGSSSTSTNVGDAAWKPSHFPHPFWAVKKTDTEEQANCKLVPYTIRNVGTMTRSQATEEESTMEPLADSWSVKVGVIENTKEIARGTELVVHWRVGRSTSTKSKIASVSWVEKAEKEARKRSRVQ